MPYCTIKDTAIYIPREQWKNAKEEVLKEYDNPLISGMNLLGYTDKITSEAFKRLESYYLEMHQMDPKFYYNFGYFTFYGEEAIDNIEDLIDCFSVLTQMGNVKRIHYKEASILKNPLTDDLEQLPTSLLIFTHRVPFKSKRWWTSPSKQEYREIAIVINIEEVEYISGNLNEFQVDTVTQTLYFSKKRCFVVPRGYADDII